MNQHQLQPHLRSWVRDGLIQPAQAEAILARYPATGRNYWMLAFAIIGAVLILGGIILIIASNWQNIPPLVKLSGLLILLTASTITAAETQRRGWPRAWWECAYLGASAFPLLGLMLISQIFHVQGKATGLVLTWVIATAALPILSRSVSAWVVQILALMSLLICTIEDRVFGIAFDFHQWCLAWIAFGALLALTSRLWTRAGLPIQRDVGEFWGILTIFITAYLWGFEAKAWFGLWCLVFLASLALIYRGSHIGKPHQVNVGFVMVALIILSVFFRLVGTMAETGVIFISGGLAILTTVWGLNRLRKNILHRMS